MKLKWVIFPDSFKCPDGKCCNCGSYVVLLNVRDLDDRYHWHPSLTKLNLLNN